MVARQLKMSIGEAVCVELPDILLVEAIEEAISYALSASKRSWSDPLIFNLSNCEYVDVAALMHLVAMFADRTDQRLATFLRIPSSRAVRDFWRVWRFPQTIEQVTQVPFEWLVPIEDHHLFERNQITYAKHGSNGNTLIHYLESAHFFSFMSYRNNSSNPQVNMAAEQRNHWSGPLISRVLDKYLHAPGNELSRVVVYEAMSNARQHPNADLVVCVSKVDWKSVTNPRSLTLSVWDNGQGICETLYERLKVEMPIRVHVAPELLEESILVENEDLESAESRPPQVIKFDYTPGLAACDYEMLVSSLFPGITRTASMSGNELSSSNELLSQSSGGDDFANYSTRGMGLYALLRTATQAYNGKMTFRTGRLIMKVRAANQKERRLFGVHYRAKYSTAPSTVPEFLGNMLTVRLPLGGGIGDTELPRY